MIIHATNYSSAQVATTVKEVICEKCGAHFVYEMLRRVVGMGVSFGIDSGGTAARAHADAADAIEYALRADEDPVACPGCGWFQASMITRNNRRYWHWSPWGEGYRINPNDGWPRSGGHFPGTPTAIPLDAQGHSPSTFFRRPPEAEPGNILSIRLFQGEFPPYCCNCFGPSEEEEQLRKKEGTFPAITIPVGKACMNRFGWRQLRYQVKYFLLFWIPSSLVCALIPFLMNFDDGWKDALVFSLAACVAGSMLLMGLFFHGGGRRGAPVKIEQVDGETLIGRVKFLRDDYRDRVRQHIATLPLSPKLLEYIAGE